MVKYCVANECPIDEGRVHMLPKTVISSASNTYAKKSKRLGIRELPLGRLKMVISTYSNILLSVSMINITNGRVGCGQERPLGLFEVLARNRQSAVGLLGRTSSAREQPNRMCTIPPRQRLSSPTGWRYEGWRVARARIRNIIRIRNRNRNRNRIRIITRVLQPPHPCNTKERKRERHTTPQAHSSQIISNLSG